MDLIATAARQHARRQNGEETITTNKMLDHTDSSKQPNAKLFPLTAPSTYEGVIYYYTNRELARFSRTVFQHSATELLSLAGGIIGPYLQNNLTQETITNYKGEPFFYENEDYEILLIGGETRPFLPFDEQSWIALAGDVFQKNTGRLVLRARDFLAFASTMHYSYSVTASATEFIGSVICLALNRQQSWFNMLAQSPKPSELSAVVNAVAIQARALAASEFLGEDVDVCEVFESIVDQLIIKLGHRLTRYIPVLDMCIERSGNVTGGWDVYSYRSFDGNISIECLGDARVLDFEMKQIT